LTTIVDVGGATGHLLNTILGNYPGTRGILFDLPHVVRDAPPLIQARGLAERVTIEAGSFFEGVPSGGDAYLLSHIIHDWSEEQCVAILGVEVKVTSFSTGSCSPLIRKGGLIFSFCKAIFRGSFRFLFTH
jgi:hypothetical protein